MNLDKVNEKGLVLLGCGKMGSAMLAGWLAGGLRGESVHVIDPQPSDWVQGLAREGLHLNGALPSSPAIAVVAVKPQTMGDALPRLQALGGAETVFLSIAAGTPIAAFERALGETTPIIRAMPNTPAAVGHGITALVGNARVDETALQLAETLLGAVGETVRLDDESQIDAVTAVSGSGPAYVFHMIECMARAGAAEGRRARPAGGPPGTPVVTARGRGADRPRRTGDPVRPVEYRSRPDSGPGAARLQRLRRPVRAAHR